MNQPTKMTSSFSWKIGATLPTPKGTPGRAMQGRTNLKKCCLGKRETQYLGFIISQGKSRPVADKVEVIQQYRLPRTLKQL